MILGDRAVASGAGLPAPLNLLVDSGLWLEAPCVPEGPKAILCFKGL